MNNNNFLNIATLLSPNFLHTRLVAVGTFFDIKSILYLCTILVFEGLVKKGILKPVQMSEGVAPFVPVLKAEKVTISICGDFHMTINPALHIPFQGWKMYCPH